MFGGIFGKAERSVATARVFNSGIHTAFGDISNEIFQVPQSSFGQQRFGNQPLGNFGFDVALFKEDVCGSGFGLLSMLL